MTAGRIRRLARAAANIPLVARTVADHVLDDPVVLGLQVSRRLPLPARMRAGSALGALPGRLADVPAAAGHAAAGRDAQLHARVERALARGASDRTRVRLADVLLAGGDAEAAGDLLASVPEDAPGRAEALARWHWHHGRMRQAVEVLPDTGRAGRLRARLAAERRALAGGVHLLEPADRRRCLGYTPRPRTALHVLTNSLPHTGSGYAQRSHSLMLALRDEGWHVEAVTRLGWPVQTGVLHAAGVDEVDGIRYHRLLPRRLAPGMDRRLGQHARMLLELVLRVRPAVLHTTTHWVNAAVVAEVAEAVGIPWVYEVRGQLADTWASIRGPEAVESERYRLFTEREDEAVRRADGVVTLGRQMAARLVAAGADPDAVVLSPNGVGGAFLGEPTPQGPARDRLGLDRDLELIGTVSSVVPYEGLHDLVRVLALLAPRRPRLRLLVVGDGTALPGLRRLAEELGVADRLITPGRLDRSLAPAAHRALDVFCVPRLDTGVTRSVTPMKPLEAMASARPTLVSDLPALREIVEHGVTGLCLPASDPQAWAEAVDHLLEHPGQRADLGRRARQWVLEHRTWAADARAYDRLYARLAVSGAA
ncbi:glycosyltransferase [Micrococcus sp.]|uniref:glycosyltransferase family 4 protein n=1 Tax=Micrococcus sp. TaxID=1271 RepID=UPI002A919E11|nr:glycosyltransferase [Micrococcus sp.]MDY6055653.1 glycosyltransferase [Micrococcus sp.]